MKGKEVANPAITTVKHLTPQEIMSETETNEQDFMDFLLHIQDFQGVFSLIRPSESEVRPNNFCGMLIYMKRLIQNFEKLLPPEEYGIEPNSFITTNSYKIYEATLKLSEGQDWVLLYSFPNT